jgi:hypothetical protein
VNANLSKLKFISAPLDGLTQHLLTRYKGTHVSPNIRVQGQKVVTMEDAFQSSKDIGFTRDDLVLMDSAR